MGAGGGGGPSTRVELTSTDRSTKKTKSSRVQGKWSTNWTGVTSEASHGRTTKGKGGMVEDVRKKKENRVMSTNPDGSYGKPQKGGIPSYYQGVDSK